MYIYVAKSLVISSFMVPKQPHQAYGGMYLKAKCSVDGQIYARCLAKYLQAQETRETRENTRGTLAIINLDRGQAGSRGAWTYYWSVRRQLFKYMYLNT